MIIMTLQVTNLLVKVIIIDLVDVITGGVANLVDCRVTVWRPSLVDDDDDVDKAELDVDKIETRRKFV